MKYYIINELTSEPIEIFFNTQKRAEAFKKKYHIFGTIHEVNNNVRQKINDKEGLETSTEKA